MDLSAKTLSIDENWLIEHISFDSVRGKLEIRIDFNAGSLLRYVDAEKGIDGMLKAYDSTEKVWRHLNFFQHVCLFNDGISRVDIKVRIIRQVSLPWNGLAHSFTLLFEAFLLELAKIMPVNRIEMFCGITNKMLWPRLLKYTVLARQEADYFGVTQIGIEKTAARKSHDYVNLLVDAIQRQDVRSNKVLKRFKHLLLKFWQILTCKQRRRFQALRLSDINLHTFQSPLIQGAFQLVYKAKKTSIYDQLVKNWYYRGDSS